MLKRILPFIFAAFMLYPAVARAGISTSSTAITPTLEQVLTAGNTSTLDMTVATATIQNITISTSTAVITPPSVVWVTDHYEGYGAVLVFGGNAYNTSSGASPGDSKYTNYSDQSFNLAIVGSPSANTGQEPLSLAAISGIDGTVDLDAILYTTGGSRYTTIVSHADTVAVVSALTGFGITTDVIATSTFTATGAGLPYGINASALTGAGVTLWGGDGVNGERTSAAVRGSIDSGNIVAATATFSADIIISNPVTPSSETEACATGTIRWDSSFIYICVSENLWKKAALAAF